MKIDVLGKIVAAALVAGSGFALGAATVPAKKPAVPAAKVANWDMVVARTPQSGVLRGNPNAGVKLVEYVSYTCPHCAHFEVEAGDALRLGLVRSGKGSVEVRNFLRNPFDVTVALLANCGTPAQFFGNHTAFMRSQNTWIQAATKPTQGQIARWSNPDFATRMRAIANDLGLYPIMTARGYSRTQLDQCLANRTLADKLANQTKDAAERIGIQGTPGFLINGEYQADTYNWNALRPKLEALTR